MNYDKEYIGRFLEKQKFIDSIFDVIFKGFIYALVFGLIMCAASMVKNIIL
jgi:hypothetical protein